MDIRKLDPFYWFDVLWDRYVGGKGIARTIAELIYTLIVAYALYLLAGFLLHTPRPAVIVASTSMLPTLHPGDVVVVRGISPSNVRAPVVEVNTLLTDHITPEQIGIHFLRNGIRLYAVEVNGRTIPVDKNGTIIVYYDDVRGRDIIHRVILKIVTPHDVYYLTKGDNDATNPTADQDCVMGYCVYPFLVPQGQVIGTPILVIPRIGIVKLILWPSSS